MSNRTLITEFPDFDAPEDILNLAPFTFEPRGNDAAPRYDLMFNDRDMAPYAHATIWVDYKDTALRCFAGFPRIVMLIAQDDDNMNEAVIWGDTWAEVRRMANEWYSLRVGYRPDDEDATLSLGQLLADVACMAYFHKWEHK